MATVTKYTVAMGFVVGGVAGYAFHDYQDRNSNPEAISPVATEVPSEIPGISVPDATLPAQPEAPETLTLPSGTICVGPLVDINVIYVPEFETHSLFRSIEQQYDPNERLSSFEANIAKADARFIATLSGLTFEELPDVDDWKPNGLPPVEPAKVPTNCSLNGQQVLR